MPSDKTILIIEDNADLLTLLSAKLEAEGCTILSAQDGNTGLEMARSKQPDLLLLDLVLPGIDGIEVLERLREDEEGSKIPVMILTNFDDPERVSSAVQHGVYDFLHKADWEIDEIVKKIREKLESLG